MSRDVVQIEKGGFPVYSADQVQKVNAMRRAKSLPAIGSPIVPTKGEALFTTAEEMHDEPASCVNCVFLRNDKRCALIGPRIPIRRLTYPKKETADSIPIEYFPCCSMHTYGTSKNPDFIASGDPDYMGLIWINAPKPGNEQGGANCGGVNDGDDCDHYSVEGKEEKWDSLTGFCRALQTNVASGDVCSLWRDDDELPWREAIKIIQEQDNATR
jgi:hypothetical protein